MDPYLDDGEESEFSMVDYEPSFIMLDPLESNDKLEEEKRDDQFEYLNGPKTKVTEYSRCSPSKKQFDYVGSNSQMKNSTLNNFSIISHIPK